MSNVVINGYELNQVSSVWVNVLESGPTAAVSSARYPPRRYGSAMVVRTWQTGANSF